MKLRHKKTGALAYSSNFNMCSMSEIHVYFEDGDADSDFIPEYEAWIEAKKEWKCLSEAFRDRDVISDNYNSHFFEPPTEEDRKRGYTL